MKKNIAVILSAGSGSRFGSTIPKQFINLAGKNIIEYTLQQFQTHPMIDEICIVANAEYHEKIDVLCKYHSFTKVHHIIQGGAQRRDSSFNAIDLYKNHTNINLIFHDAVRPFVSHRIISETINALTTHDAVDVAIPSADTIIQVNPSTTTIDNIPQRAYLQRGQTPQAFSLETIQKAHILAQKDTNSLPVTDDCGLIKHYLPETQIFVVQGEEKNIKITYPEDLLFAEKLIQFETHPSSNFTTDLKALQGKVIVVFGGHSGIGKSIIEIGSNNQAICVSLSRENGVDIQSPKAIRQSLEAIIASHGQIDHVINCAAELTKMNISGLTDDAIVQSIQTNLTGAVYIAKYCYPYLKETQGSLTFFTSSSYTRGRPEYSLYSATKAAIVNFTQAIAQEWKNDNIRVNAINPERTLTPMRTKNFGDEPKDTLLEPHHVALKTLQSLLSPYSGLIIDIKKGIDESINR